MPTDKEFAQKCTDLVKEFETLISNHSRPYERHLQLAIELRHLASLPELSHERAANFRDRVRRATHLCKGKMFDRLKAGANSLLDRCQ